MTKAIEDMTREEMEEFMRESLINRYRNLGRVRLSFDVGGTKCFTEPMTAERLVEVYHGYPQTEDYDVFTEMLDASGADSGSPFDGPWPTVQYEYIEGKVWRNFGQDYPA